MHAADELTQILSEVPAQLGRTADKTPAVQATDHHRIVRKEPVAAGDQL